MPNRLLHAFFYPKWQEPNTAHIVHTHAETGGKAKPMGSPAVSWVRRSELMWRREGGESATVEEEK